MLELIQVSKKYGEVMVLAEVTAQFPRGRITALIGTNGAGKTTLLNVATGLVAPDTGTISLGSELGKAPDKPQDFRKRGVIRTFQEPRIFPQLTPLENVRFGRPESLSAVILRAFRHLADDDWNGRAAAEGTLSQLGLNTKEDKPSSDLSHGQQRLVELALAFNSPGEIYLFDEPSAGLAPEPRKVVHEKLRELKAEGSIVVVVDHDVEFVQAVADKIVFLDAGRVVAAGSPEDVLDKPEVKGHLWGAWET